MISHKQWVALHVHSNLTNWSWLNGCDYSQWLCSPSTSLHALMWQKMGFTLDKLLTTFQENVENKPAIHKQQNNLNDREVKKLLVIVLQI